jgi:uncharacterized damage-inducible protein DinB
MIGSVPALARLIDDLATLVAQLTPEAYARSAVGAISGSIGGHVRHCLDHVLALERGFETGVVDYEARHRRTAIEHDRSRALEALVAGATRLRSRGDLTASQPMVVRACAFEGGPIEQYGSTLGREVAFVISHTIHHNATIALLADRVGHRRLPYRFGIAPGTPSLAGAA